MRIFIEEFDEAVTTWGYDTGHLIVFRSVLTSGLALLAATYSVTPALRGREIHVETGQRDMEDVRALRAEEPHTFRLVALPEAGNYEAVGEITGEVQDDGDGLARIYVSVGEARFSWSTLDISQGALPGEWVRFTVIGLVLWDTNT